MKIQTGKTLLRSMALTCAVGFATAAQSAVTRFDGTDWIGEGAFSESANWQGGRDDTSTAEARFNGQAGKIVRFDSLYSLTGYIWVGEWGDAASDYNLYISADGSTKNPVVFTANPGNGFNITGNLAIADGENQTGALQVLTGAYGVGGILNLAEGNYSQGYLRVEQGALTVEGAAYAARCGWDAGVTSKATLEVKDGTLTINGCDTDQESAGLLVGVGKNTSASIVVDNGTLSVPNGGTMLYPNGEWDNSDDSITVNVRNGGTFSTGGALTLGRYGSESITVDVSSSGTLAAKSITRGGANGTATINLNNGTLKALDDGTFISNGQNGIDIYVGDEGATIDTNNRSITIEAPISGEGTLTLVGGGTVTFLGTVACTIAAQDGTQYVQEGNPDGAFYWIGEAGANWNDGMNWSMSPNGSAANNYPKDVQNDVAVFVNGGTVTVNDGARAKTVICHANVTLSGTAALQSYEIKGSGLLTLDSAKLQTPRTDWVNDANLDIANDINVIGDNTLVLTASTRIRRGVLNINGAVTGSGSLTVAKSDVNDTYGELVRFGGNNAGFSGTCTMAFTKGSRGNNSYGMKFLTANSGSAAATWNIFYGGEASTSDGLFNFSNGTIEFGSLNTRLPAYTSATYGNNTVKVGILGNTDNMAGSWGVSAGNTIYKVGSGLLNDAVANTASLKIGGGEVALTADGVPAEIHFVDDGGYLVFSQDASLNASIVAALASVGDAAFVGLSYSGATEQLLDFTAVSSVLSGKKIVKKGSGTLIVSGLPSNSVCDIDVSEGVLVATHGASVGSVAVAENAQFLVDMTGAGDNEVVFTYGSLAGNVSYRNLASVGRLDVDDVANTWTYVVTGSARTFKWNGTEGASWTEPNNWLVVDGDSATTATEIPSAIDTAVIESDAAISVPATIAGNVVVSSGATLTITPGITFANSLTLDGNLAFDMTLDGVGASTPLVTVGGTGSSVSVANFILPATYEVTGTGTFTAKRVAGTYTWTGSVDNSWATSGNWKVGDMAVTEVPALEDSVVFPANDAEGFQAWEVTLPWDVYADTVTLNANVVLCGARTLKAHTINGEAELRLNNAHLGSNGAVMDVYCPLNVMPNTTNYIYLQKFGNTAGSAYIVNIRGPLYGSGELKADHAGVQGVGVKFYGDNKDFWGTFTSSNYNSRDYTDMGDYTSSSSNAVWNVYTYNNVSDQALIVHGTDTYYFGALNGGLQMGSAGGSKSPNQTVSIEVGARDDVASSFALASHVNYNKGYDVCKVGTNTMTIVGQGWAGGNNVFRLNSLTIAGGTASIPALPNEYITFKDNGGTLQLTDATLDASAKIVNSTAAIGYDTGDGDVIWATAVPDTNLGGLTKYGAGTLTLAVEPLYAGLTTVMEGTLVLPTGSMFFTDSSRPVGALGNGTITGADGAALEIYKYAFPAGTVLYGDEKGADEAAKLANIIPGNLDFSNVTGVDVSAKTLVAGEPFVLAFFDGNITGLNKNNIELTVPERPEGVREDKWRWAVRVMTKTYQEVEGGEPVSKSYKCVCVAPEVIPFSIHLR